MDKNSEYIRRGLNTLSHLSQLDQQTQETSGQDREEELEPIEQDLTLSNQSATESGAAINQEQQCSKEFEQLTLSEEEFPEHEMFAKASEMIASSAKEIAEELTLARVKSFSDLQNRYSYFRELIMCTAGLSYLTADFRQQYFYDTRDNPIDLEKAKIQLQKSLVVHISHLNKIHELTDFNYIRVIVGTAPRFPTTSIESYARATHEALFNPNLEEDLCKEIQSHFITTRLDFIHLQAIENALLAKCEEIILELQTDIQERKQILSVLSGQGKHFSTGQKKYPSILFSLPRESHLGVSLRVIEKLEAQLSSLQQSIELLLEVSPKNKQVARL